MSTVEHDPAAFFRAETRDDGEVLVPQARAVSGWGGAGAAQLRGTAVSGVLARAAERVARGLDDADRFRPVRWTLDLFRPAGTAPATTVTTVVRQGRRLRLVDTAFVQDDRTVARGTALFLVTGGTPDGTAWAGRPAAAPLPVPDLRPATTEPTLYYSEDVGWTDVPDPHDNAGRKGIWYLPDVLVAGEEPSGFQHAATVADASNMVSNWGTAGIAFINADLTLALTRLPATGAGVGLVAEQRTEQDGITLGTTRMVDEHGPVGTVLVSTVVHGGAAVQPGRVEPTAASSLHGGG